MSIVSKRGHVRPRLDRAPPEIRHRLCAAPRDGHRPQRFRGALHHLGARARPRGALGLVPQVRVRPPRGRPRAHRAGSGYDFGYLVKLLTAMSLPTTEDVFFERLRTWFPHCYDIKFMMRACKSLKGGLQDVADDLGVRGRSCVGLNGG